MCVCLISLDFKTIPTCARLALIQLVDQSGDTNKMCQLRDNEEQIMIRDKRVEDSNYQG